MLKINVANIFLIIGIPLIGLVQVHADVTLCYGGGHRG